MLEPLLNCLEPLLELRGSLLDSLGTLVGFSWDPCWNSGILEVQKGRLKNHVGVPPKYRSLEFWLLEQSCFGFCKRDAFEFVFC